MKEKTLKSFFILFSAIILISLLLSGRDAGISCDEILHYDHSVTVYNFFATIEIIGASIGSLLWIIMRENFTIKFLTQIEPMVVGLIFSVPIHVIGIFFSKRNVSSYIKTK